MAKITTEYLKTQITTWLSSPEEKKRMYGHWTDDKDLSYIAKEFGLQESALKSQIDEKAWKEWSSGDCWKRFEKRRINEDEIAMMFDARDGRVRYLPEFMGAAFPVIDNITPTSLEKCIVRAFVPRNDFIRNNFYMTIVTTPDDSEVVVWDVHTD